MKKICFLVLLCLLSCASFAAESYTAKFVIANTNIDFNWSATYPTSFAEAFIFTPVDEYSFYVTHPDDVLATDVTLKRNPTVDIFNEEGTLVQDNVSSTLDINMYVDGTQSFSFQATGIDLTAGNIGVLVGTNETGVFAYFDNFIYDNESYISTSAPEFYTSVNSVWTKSDLTAPSANMVYNVTNITYIGFNVTEITDDELGTTTLSFGGVATDADPDYAGQNKFTISNIALKTTMENIE